jgi:hypothetical protein
MRARADRARIYWFERRHVWLAPTGPHWRAFWRGAADKQAAKASASFQYRLIGGTTGLWLMPGGKAGRQGLRDLPRSGYRLRSTDIPDGRLRPARAARVPCAPVNRLPMAIS